MSHLFSKLPKGLIAILIFALLLRLPSLFEPYWYGDEGIYLTLGAALRKGLTFYRDIHDNKPPLLYLIAALSTHQFWFRFILLWWNLVNIYLIYLLSRKILRKTLPALVSSLAFVVLPLILESNIPNGEIFMIMPTTAAMLLLINVKSQFKIKNYFLSGVLFSLAFLFKAPAVFSFLAALTFLLFFDLSFKGKVYKTGSKLKKGLTIFLNFSISQFLNCSFLLFGFIALPALSFLYYWQKGALLQYWKAAFIQNVGYLSSWGNKGDKALISLSSGFTQRFLLFSIVLISLFVYKKKLTKKFLFIILWFIFALFAALLSGRPYPHYLIQIIPPLSILLLFLFGKKRGEKTFTLFVLFILVFSFFYYQFWRYPVLKYYQNFYQFTVGQKDKEKYFSFFDWRVNRTYKLAHLIKVFTDDWDYIFIWGNEPYLYAMTERLPPGRYTVAYHISDFDGQKETIKAIKEKKPSLIIITEKKSFVELEKIIKENYCKIAEEQGASVYKKI